jgi:protein-disulfide isomerase
VTQSGPGRRACALLLVLLAGVCAGAAVSVEGTADSIEGTADGTDGAAAAIGGAPGVREVQMPLEPTEPARGSAAAPLTMVEFTDYQCPYCRRFQAQVWPRLRHDYVDTGKLRFVVRDLPLSFHAGAKPAAEAAHCAGEQGRFWPMHDALLGKDSDLSAHGIEQHARTLGLDLQRFDACVTAGKYAATIERNAAQADALGLRGTPAFVIGRVQHGELTGWPVEGALPYEDFDALLRQLLAGG